MKTIMIIMLCLISVMGVGQTKGYFRYDTTVFERVGGNNEVYIKNGTRTLTGGVLTNMGNGLSRWVAAGVSPFDATVDFSVNVNPNTVGTTFNPNTPQLTTKIYVSTVDGSQWTWNGAAYIIYAPTGWGVFGNAGTTPGTNFIGTTDNAGLMFKMDNTQSGFIDETTDNTSLGKFSLNAATGLSSGNTAFGFSSLRSTTGVSNTAIGFHSLFSNSTGGSNIAIGNEAGNYNTTASSQLFINSIDRTNYTGDTSASPIYAQQNATVSSQRTKVNGTFDVNGPVRFSGALMPNNTAGTAGEVLTSAGAGAVPTWQAPSGGGLTVGTTTITSGTNTRILYNNSGVLGEYTLTGTGTTVAMGAAPAFTGLLTGADANFTGLLSVGANPLSVDIAGSKSGLQMYFNTTSTTAPVSLLMGTTAAFSKSIRFQAYPASYATSGMEIADNGGLFTVGMPFNVGTYSAHHSDFWTNNTRRGGISSGGAIDFVSLAGTGTRSVTADAGGVLAAGPIIASGTYTPTLTNVTNITASTAYDCQYLRVGNTVTVSGKVDIDVTLGAASELGMSLPIASNMTAEENLGGTASSPAAASLVSAIRADFTNDRAALVFTAISLTNDSYFFEFTYQIK